MSEKKENKCNGCCGKKRSELNSEELEKVTGGRHWENDKYICPDHHRRGITCIQVKTVDGIANVCACPNLKTSKCCEQLGDSCTCHWWDKKRHECDYCVD